jgi:hypothetical protein
MIQCGVNFLWLFVHTPIRCSVLIFFNLIKLQYYKLAMSYAKQTNNNGYNYELFEDREPTL